jgi:hypothetical protein
MSYRTIFFLLIVACITKIEARTLECATGAYPPPDKQMVSSAIINLDQPPMMRWVNLSTMYREQIHSLLDLAKQIVAKQNPQLFASEFSELITRFPIEYADEIRGVAKGAQLDLGDVIFYNLFFEMFTFSTSIIGQDTSGHIYHGHNLDFGFLTGYNFSSHTSELNKILRSLTVSIDFVRHERLIFKSVHFVGYIGVLTGIKPYTYSVRSGIMIGNTPAAPVPNGYAISINNRVDMNFNAELIEWINNHNDPSMFLGLTLRNIFVTVDFYHDAVLNLQNKPLISSVYFVISGSNSIDAAIITRDKNVTMSTVTLEQQLNQGIFYLAETNYDQYYNNGTSPWFDQRQYVATHCLNSFGSANFNSANLYHVLYTKPIRNELTTYTVLMSAQESARGLWQVWHQSCDSPCPLW